MSHLRALELWRPVLGFGGAYEVSNCGGVRSVDRTQVRPSDGRVFRRRGQVLKPGTHPKGHRYVHLTNGTTRYVHDLVLEAFVSPRPDGLLGLHSDDNQSNNRVSNLRWGTYSDNNRDCVRNGKHHWAGKTACPRGHLLVPPNLQASQLPRRGCKACNRMSATIQNMGVARTPELMQSVSDAHYARIMAGA